jgi:hypothetical protein
MLDTPRTRSTLRTGPISHDLFGGEEGMGGYELTAGVGVGDGYMGSSTMASSPPTLSMGLEPPLGARRDAAHAGGGSRPEKRHGLAVEVPWIDRRQ